MTRKDCDIFGLGSNFEKRVFRDYDQLLKQVNQCKNMGLKVVLTSGTFDLFHIGHSRYLEKAKECGDILIVGVDSDKKVRKKKGPHRPIVNEDERMEILCHCRHVGMVFLKQASDRKWRFIRAVRPDVLIATKRIYEKRDLVGLDECCGDIIVLESQATASTTARIRRILISPIEEVKGQLRTTVEEVCAFLDDLTGGE